MKQKNFPARKLARKIAADLGKRFTARNVLEYPDISEIKPFNSALDSARSTRTKKRR